MLIRHEIDRLYEIAEDYEADVLDRLRERAGITWTHESPSCTWTNLAGEACRCGKTQEQAQDDEEEEES